MSTSEGIPDFESRLSTLAQRWSADRDIAAAYLHGSRARGNARPQSDVDLAVVLRRDLTAAERWRKRLALLEAAASAFATDAVDLLVLEEAPSVLGHRVLRDGRLIVDNDPHRRVEVVESIFRRYLDEEWLRRLLDEGLRTRLAEGCFAR